MTTPGGTGTAPASGAGRTGREGRDALVLAVDLGTGGPKIGFVSVTGQVVWQDYITVATLRIQCRFSLLWRRDVLLGGNGIDVRRVGDRVRYLAVDGVRLLRCRRNNEQTDSECEKN